MTTKQPALVQIVQQLQGLAIRIARLDAAKQLQRTNAAVTALLPSKDRT